MFWLGVRRFWVHFICSIADQQGMTDVSKGSEIITHVAVSATMPISSAKDSRMIDFTPIHRRQMRLREFVEARHITQADLIQATNEMIDSMLTLVADVADADVIFVPEDADAYDPYANNPEETRIGWTLGHIIAHATASSEECCAHAATLARGAKVCGRNRYEVPWQEIRTRQDLHQRLEESRRIRLAYLQAWPAAPHLENTYTPYKSPQNCIMRVLAGLIHDDSHLDQIRDVIRQARAHRA